MFALLHRRFQTRITAARKIGDRLVRLVLHHPVLQKIVRALVDTRIGFHRGIQGDISEALAGVLRWRLLAASELSKDIAPPAVEARPPAVMTVQIVSRADVRIGRAQMSIDQPFRKAGRAIVNVNIGQFLVARNGELNRRRTVLQTETPAKALVINTVVAITRELPASPENVNCVGLEVHIQSKLTVAAA